MSTKLKGGLFQLALLLSLGVGFLMLGVLLIDVFTDGLPYLDWTLLTQPPSTDPEIAGARPAIIATLYMGLLLLLFTVPIGVFTAIYLEEYADKTRWYNRLLEINIQNLAAVPSIVYGILGLAFLVRGLGLGRVLLAGAMILTLLVLPTVIIAAREAIRAVPDSIRQGAYALGATQWQVVSRQVLPAAVPGIATGSILALSRAIGETAPLIMIGAVTYIAFDPTILGPFTALPIQIYQFLRLPQEEFKLLAAASIIVLLGILLTLNAFAIWIRNRYPENVVTTIDERFTTIEPMSLAEIAREGSGETFENREAVFEVKDLAVDYSGNVAIEGVTLDVYRNSVTAFIGPSGCGKSTFIRCFNRMNDLVPGAHVKGDVLYHGKDLYASDVDPVEVRRRIGMVFQKPNPFPKSIYDNVAFGPRVLGLKGKLDERVEHALQRAALWDEVKNRLKESALGLSGGQQQRLCIARCLAVEPDVILMDEPASALDPISTTRIEDLMHELKRDYTIVIVTHNMQQAARVADMTAFFSVDVAPDDDSRTGILVEYDRTSKIFTTPADKRTEAYVTGRFG